MELRRRAPNSAPDQSASDLLWNLYRGSRQAMAASFRCDSADFRNPRLNESKLDRGLDVRSSCRRVGKPHNKHCNTNRRDSTVSVQGSRAHFDDAPPGRRQWCARRSPLASRLRGLFLRISRLTQPPRDLPAVFRGSRCGLSPKGSQICFAGPAREFF